MPAGTRCLPATRERGRPAEIDREPSFGEIVAAWLTDAASGIREHGQAFRARGRAESVHALRVAIRRLRAALSAARKCLEADRVDALRRESDDIAIALGAVRDLDVFVHETLPAIAARAEPGERRALRTLAHAATRHRALLGRQARADVPAARLARLASDIDTLAARGTAPGADERLQRHARDVLGKKLSRRHEALVHRSRRVADLDDDALHALRIAAKKQRYLCEAIEALYPKRPCRRYRAAVVGLQRVFGDMRDAAAAGAHAERHGASATATKTVESWMSKRRRKHRRAMIEAATKFRAAPPFWTS